MNSVKPHFKRGYTEPSLWNNTMAKKTLVLHQDKDTGCIVPVSHKLNQDGYFRKRIGNRLVMYHIHIWEKHHGKLPDGFEVHHLCGNRACCNIEHLEALDGHYHTVQGNQERYQERYQEAKTFWIATECTGTELGNRFGVTFSTGCKWIRQWKKEGVETSWKQRRGRRVRLPRTPEARDTGPFASL